MQLAAKETRELLDDLTNILLALGLLRERTPLSMQQRGLLDRALGSARDLERLAVGGIARRQPAGGLSHAAARRQLGDALDGSPAAPERGRLAAHLAACPSCRAFGRTLEATVALARQLPRAELPATAREGLRRLVAGAKGEEVQDAVRAPSAGSGTGAAGSAAGAGAGSAGPRAARAGPGADPDPVSGAR
jgi:hypothetical protein